MCGMNACEKPFSLYRMTAGFRFLRLPEESGKQLTGEGIRAPIALGMPLNADDKPARCILLSFDHSIGRGRNHSQIPSRLLDALMMIAVYFSRRGPGQTCEETLRIQTHHVPGRPLGIIVNCGARNKRRDVLDQPAAAKHVK